MVLMCEVPLQMATPPPRFYPFFHPIADDMPVPPPPSHLLLDWCQAESARAAKNIKRKARRARRAAERAAKAAAEKVRAPAVAIGDVG